MKHRTYTIETAKRMSSALVPHVNALLMARAHAALQREKMDAIDRACIAQVAPINQYTGHPIAEPKDTWQMDDDTAIKYYAMRDRLIREAGYDVEPGYCPALIAESLVVKAEHNLIDGVHEFMPEVNTNGLLCLGLEKYREFIRLTIGLVVNAPTYRKPALAGGAA